MSQLSSMEWSSPGKSSGQLPGWGFESFQLQPIPIPPSKRSHLQPHHQQPHQPSPPTSPNGTQQPHPPTNAIIQPISTPSPVYPSINFNINGVPLTADLQVLSPNRSTQQQATNSSVVPSASMTANESISRNLSPIRMDASFRGVSGNAVSGNGLNASVLNASSSSAMNLSTLAQQQQAKSVGQLNDMLARSREGLIKLQSELDAERSRRIATERDLVDVKRDLSNERLGVASNGHHLAIAADKEARLLRELQLAKLLEQQLRTDVADVSALARDEKEARIRLEERVESLSDDVRRLEDRETEQSEEINTLRTQLSQLQTSSSSEIASLKQELSTSQENLRKKTLEFVDVQRGLELLSKKLESLEREKKLLETDRARHQESADRKIDELTRQLATAQATAESSKEEANKLAHMVRDNATKMSQQFDRQQSELFSQTDAKLSSLHDRLASAQQQQHALGRFIHDGALTSTALQEKLTACEETIERLRDDIRIERKEKEDLISHHATQFREMQGHYSRQLTDMENHARERFSSAQSHGIDDLKHSFGLSIDSFKHEFNRALDRGLNGQEIVTPSLHSHREDIIFSPTSPRQRGINQSEHDGTLGQSALQEHLSSSLNLLASAMLTSLSSTFTQLRKSTDRREYDLNTQIALLKQEAEFHRSQAEQRKEGEEQLSQRLQDLSLSSNNDLKKIKAELADAQSLLEERANVIRELKKRYKREQSITAESKQQLSAIKSELANLRLHHQAELEQLRVECQKELNDSLTQAEAIAEKRLEAENKLRKRAEEESDKYVRACQQNEERIFLLEQEKDTMIHFFKAQLSEMRLSKNTAASNAATASFTNFSVPLSISTASTLAASRSLSNAAALAESEARIARMVREASPTHKTTRTFSPSKSPILSSPSRSPSSSPSRW